MNHYYGDNERTHADMIKYNRREFDAPKVSKINFKFGYQSSSSCICLNHCNYQYVPLAVDLLCQMMNV